MKRHSLDLVIVVALFCVYAFCALTLSVIGVQVYQRTADTIRSNYNDRTSILYIVEKIRHNDLEGSVRIDTHNGSDALVLTERESGRNFEVWLFVEDGMLYEGLFAPGAVLDTALCQAILPMESMNISNIFDASEASEQLITVTFCTPDKQVSSIYLSLRSAGESDA